METDTSKLCVLHDAIERLRNDISVDGYTVGTCECEIGLRPCWTGLKLIGDLSFSMLLEVIDGDGVHINGSAPTLGFRCGCLDRSVATYASLSWLGDRRRGIGKRQHQAVGSVA